MFTKMLIPLDGSKTAEKVLPYARYLAGKFKIPVELFAVIDIAEMATHISAEKVRHLDTMIEDAVRASTTYLHGIATTFRDVKVTCTVEKDRAEDAIIGKGDADTAMLIAMATHGRSGLDRFLLGSVAEKVLRATANPLLLVRATEEAKAEGEAVFKSVIVALDGSELAESVIPMMAGVAKTLDLEVILLRAAAGVRDEANEYLAKKMADIKKLGVTKVSAVTKEGFAGDEIIDMGRKTADSFIAMSSHGRSGVKRWVLGSVTETVVRHSGDPVLVLRAK
jgi:nucleotide-binding universal stress UspA family protein